ncbi:hypothetical protein Ait01nite_014680 [Actinoplanes italicus]|uniref:Uncharacterized protein n=1 Tax=Actinoplanes italicus TaxID=113567 RepID=A0A2T0KHJ1_9ACTN|nr:hypothetical protein [Actinoplanes italicus]PRX22902.1 hypothetical protein CLV67_104430 [Actinoplanes italicus]GIE28423.1 hypothetical protein Ait01nite_014680 [Actinoplanes italicus]
MTDISGETPGAPAPATSRPLFGRSAAAILAAVVMVGTALFAVSPAEAAAAPCHGWRTLVHGETGLNAVVEPGQPWHVRLGRGGNGFQNFMFCDAGTHNPTGTRKVAFSSNAYRYLTADISTGRVSATGTNPDGFDYWFVCYLDSTWVEIRFSVAGHYLGRNSSGYVIASDMTPNGNILWHRSQFDGLSLTRC